MMKDKAGKAGGQMPEQRSTGQKLLIYILKRVLAIALLALLLAVVFAMAMDITNIAILAGDGFKEYANNVLTGEDTDELTKYFTDGFISRMDMPNKRATYNDYAINDFEHKLSLEWVWLFPWGSSASAVVTDTVENITGELPSEIADVSPARPISPPAWINAKYTIRLIKVYDDTLKTDIWKIDDAILQSKIAPSPSPSASPEASVAPSPGTSPSASQAAPAASAAPSASP
jgi:hypothetical protein